MNKLNVAVFFGAKILEQGTARELTNDEMIEVCKRSNDYGWTSAKSLPPANKEFCVDVWSITKGRVIDCSYCHDRCNWYSYHDDLIDDATHWMEQPDEPKATS